jgi:hypothetical protein
MFVVKKIIFEINASTPEQCLNSKNVIIICKPTLYDLVLCRPACTFVCFWSSTLPRHEPAAIEKSISKLILSHLQAVYICESERQGFGSGSTDPDPH